MNPTTVRAYIDSEVHEMVDTYARKNGITLQNAYKNIICNSLDRDGIIKNQVLMSESQQKIISEIADGLHQTAEKTVQELINYALMVYGTRITLRELFIVAAPVMMDDLVNSNPEIAKEILKGLKNKPTTSAGSAEAPERSSETQ